MSSPTTASDPNAPFSDLVVIDFSQVLAGPYIGRMFSDLGADVIKIEAPGGDMVRVIAPKHDRGMSGLFTWVNAGKRDVCVDLTTSAGKLLVHELLGRADVVLQNFRPGVAERLGIGWDEVHATNPRAVMISISGFGADSTLRDRGAFAPSIHAASGLLEYHARKTHNPVQPLADARADLTTALHGMVGVLTALRVAEKTGVGEHVELAMYDAVLSCYEGVPFELLEPPEERYDTDPFDAGPNGWIVVAGPLQHIWAQLSAAFGLADPSPPGSDIATKARTRHARLEEWMATLHDPPALVRSLESSGLACAPVQSLRDALTGAFGRERELLVEIDDRRGGTRSVVRSPWRFSRSSVAVRGPAPERGEHNAEVLRDLLGASETRIAELASSGVLQSVVDEASASVPEPDSSGRTRKIASTSAKSTTSPATR